MSDTAMIPFRFDGTAVRTLLIDGEPWFVGRDVAEVLGYAKPENAIAAHCKGTLKRGLLTPGGEQQMTVIPERDLYRLIMRSKLPSAERFEEWVVGDVLPTLRKTGRYSMPGAEPPSAAPLDLDIARQWVALAEKIGQMAGIDAARTVLERSPLLVAAPPRAGGNSPSPNRSNVTSAVIDRFLTDCTEPSPNGRVSAAALWSAYQRWRAAAGAEGGPTTVNGFGRALRSRLRFIKSDGRNHYLDRRLVAGYGTQIEASRAGGL